MGQFWLYEILNFAADLDKIRLKQWFKALTMVLSLVTWFSCTHLKKIPCLFIQEKLDFAIHDIIFDLLSIGRTSRQISPEVLHWKLLLS